MALWYYLLFTCVFYLSVPCLHTATIVTSSLMQACILAGKHNYDIIMSAMVSQIIGVSIVFSTIYWGADQRKRQSCASLASLCGNSPVTGEFPAQMASTAENVSIWWRHHEIICTLNVLIVPIWLILLEWKLAVFLLCYLEQAAGQTVKLRVIWDAMTTMWRHCNGCEIANKIFLWCIWNYSWIHLARISSFVLISYFLE